MELENYQHKPAYEPEMQPDSDEIDVVTSEHPLDSPDSVSRLIRLEDWWYQARQALAPARYEMALDRDFYDGLQWSEEDKLVLAQRGQAPTTFNKIKPSLDWIIGTEKRTRIDYKVLPRTDDDVEGADIKTKLLKYLSDVNKTAFARSHAFSDSIISGVGWLEDGIRNDPTEEMLYSRYEDWKNIWWDHLAVQQDLSDARYLFRSKWVDLDIATAMFPDRAGRLSAAAKSFNAIHDTDDDEFFWLQGTMTRDGKAITSPGYADDAFNVDNRRDRVRLIEAWYRIPSQVQVMRGHPALEGAIFREADPYMAQLVEGGHVSLFGALKMVVRCAVFIGGVSQTTGCLLQDMDSPYIHNRFPFTPTWCYRRGRDRMPYGVVRNLRDPQEDLNKRRSKSLYILSSKGLIADEDAFEDWDEAIEEYQRPDMVLKKKKGAEVEIVGDNALAEEHVMLAQEDARHIQDVAGVTDENMGRETNAVSGRAIQARQTQGSLTTAEPFDNLRFASQLSGEKQLSLVEQFYDQEKIIRLTGPRGQAEFFAVNQMMMDEYGQPKVMNDITATKADFIISDQDFRESVRIALFEAFMNLCAQLPPEISVQLLDEVVDLSDLPGKDSLVKRIRQINGQQDPDEPEDSPEAMARQQAEAEQQQIAQAAMMTQLAEQEAKVKKLLAEVELIIEKAKTEQVTRAETAVRLQMDQQQGVADERERRHRRNLDTFQATHKAGVETQKGEFEREKFKEERKDAAKGAAKKKPSVGGRK